RLRAGAGRRRPGRLARREGRAARVAEVRSWVVPRFARGADLPHGASASSAEATPPSIAVVTRGTPGLLHFHHPERRAVTPCRSSSATRRQSTAGPRAAWYGRPVRAADGRVGPVPRTADGTHGSH